METRIRRKQYQEGAKLYSHKKRVLFYNDNNEILVYYKKGGLFFPTQVVPQLISLEEYIRNKYHIEFKNENMEELIKIISYDFKYKSENNKLIKEHLKFIRDYYTCLTELTKETESIKPIITPNNEILTPCIMDIEEAIEYLTSEQTSKRGTDKEQALEALNQKLKTKKLYERIGE